MTTPAGVTVVAGAGSITAANLVCQTIWQIRDMLDGVLTIDPGATAFINGVAVNEDAKPKAGDQVTFARQLGQKG